MAELAFTPGPWSLNKYGELVDVNGENIRVKGMALTNSDEAKANTRLIAQAPAMLEACEAAFFSKVGIDLGSRVKSNGWRWPKDAPTHVHPVAEQLRAVIAAATGEAP